MDPLGSKPHLTWSSVALAFSFIIFDSVLPFFFRLKVGSSLLIAGVRCVVQLGIVSLILQSIFDANSPWAVAGITCLLNVLGALETTVNRSTMRYRYMFPAVLSAMIVSTIPISLITMHYIMGVEPFWKPERYIPVVGMLAGSTISGMAVVLNTVLREVYQNDNLETYLAFGASRIEACIPIAQQALHTALTPPVNQMSTSYSFVYCYFSVIGIISIPGMMTGAILGGSSVEQAAKLQMVIMFCLSASTALGSMVSAISCLAIVIDGEHRIREDRIDAREHIIWRTRDRIGKAMIFGIKRMFLKAMPAKREEQDPLLHDTDPGHIN